MVFPKPYVPTKKCPNCGGDGWDKVPGFVGSPQFPCKVCNRTGVVEDK